MRFTLASRGSDTTPRHVREAETVDPGALAPAARDAFLRQLYAVHQRIFDGLTLDAFGREIDRQDAIRNRIQVYRNDEGEAVGYCGLHLLEIRCGDDELAVLHCEAGLLPDYRGGTATLLFGAREAFRHLVRHPLSRLVMFVNSVHPSSYRLLCKGLWRCYPRPDRPIPEHWRRIMLEIADHVGSEPVDPGDPMVRQVGWITRESAADAEAWKSMPDAIVQYFLARNPDYAKGHGLPVLAPLTFLNLLVSFIGYAARLAARRWRLGRFGRHSRPASPMPE